MPALQVAGYGKGDHGTTDQFYFGYYEGDSAGYMYKANEFPLICDGVAAMLAEEDDLTIKNIVYAEKQWVVFGEHVDGPKPEGREFVMWESYDEFDKGIQERVAQAKRPVSVCAGDDGRWAAYFEGKITGKASTVVCDSNEEFLELMEKKVGEEGYSLQCCTFGVQADDPTDPGSWFMFFMNDTIQGDAQWTMNSKYMGDDGFIDTVKQHMDNDITMRQCTFGNKVWFGYWEGDVEGGNTFAWTSQPKLTGFLDHTKELWDQDGEEEEAPAPAGGDDDDEV
jgi:hypothetical protein